MGGWPIRGNEWLSTTGHSACHVEMRNSFERRKLTLELNDVSLIILVSLGFFSELLHL